MSSSTAQQQTDTSALWNDRHPQRRRTDTPATLPTDDVDRPFTTTTGFSLPKLEGYSSVDVETARLAGRMSAASVSPKEHADLLRERQDLLDKMFDGSFTRSQRARLEYVRWSLDRIEDAKHGLHLDLLDNAVRAYERLSDDLTSLKAEFQRHARR
jgi:hypothetical protein